MNLIKHDTNPGDLVKVQIPKRFEVHVNKAIADSVKLLTIQEFIRRTDFELDVESFDVLYFNINDELPVYLTETILDWMGYEGETKFKRKNCKELLKSNFTEGQDFFIYKNSAYKTWRKAEIKGAKVSTLKNLLPRPATGSAARSKKHIVIMPDTFKELAMTLRTKKGSQIRRYYITLEKLVKAYVCYQTLFRFREAEYVMTHKDGQIGELNDHLKELIGYTKGIKTEVVETRQELREEHKKTTVARKEARKTREKIERILPDYVVMKSIPENQKELIYVFRHTNHVYGIESEYHIFRCQKRGIKSCLHGRIKKVWKERRQDLHLPAVRPVFESLDLDRFFEHNPNAVAFWTWFSEEEVSKGSIELEPGNKMRFNMIVNEEDFIESLEWADFERS